VYAGAYLAVYRNPYTPPAGRIVGVPESASVETVYQVRVVLAEVSPLIWRRLQVAGSTTLTGLHQVLQTAFDWTATTCTRRGLRHHRRRSPQR